MTLPWFEHRLNCLLIWGTYYPPSIEELPTGYTIDGVEVSPARFWASEKKEKEILITEPVSRAHSAELRYRYRFYDFVNDKWHFLNE